MNYSLKLFVFVILTNSVQTELVQRVTGFVTKELESDSVYELVAPVIFKVDLPNNTISGDMSEECSAGELSCALLKQAAKLNEGIMRFESEYRQAGVKSKRHTHQRSKREIFFAMIAGAVAGGGMVYTYFRAQGSYDSTISALRSNDQVISENIKKLQEAEKRNSKTLATLVENLHFTAMENERGLKDIMAVQNATKIELGLLHQTQLVMLDYLRFRNFINACKLRLIPDEVITLNDLEKAYKNITEKADAHSLVPSISKSELIKMFSLPLTSCVFGDSIAIVTVGIPLRKRANQTKLFEVQAVPFRHENQMCAIHTKVKYLASYDNVLQPILTQSCKLDQGLCKTGESYNSLETRCLQRVLAGGTLKDLKTCPFECLDLPINPVVITIKEKHFILGVGNVTVSCDNVTNASYVLPELGSLQLILPFGCTGIVADQTIYPSGELHQDIKFSAITVLPGGWARENDALVNINPTYKDYREIYDPRWMKKLKVINMTIPKDEDYREISELHTMDDVLVFFRTYWFKILLYVWITILQGIIVFLFVGAVKRRLRRIRNIHQRNNRNRGQRNDQNRQERNERNRQQRNNQERGIRLIDLGHAITIFLTLFQTALCNQYKAIHPVAIDSSVEIDSVYEDVVKIVFKLDFPEEYKLRESHLCRNESLLCSAINETNKILADMRIWHQAYDNNTGVLYRKKRSLMTGVERLATLKKNDEILSADFAALSDVANRSNDARIHLVEAADMFKKDINIRQEAFQRILNAHGKAFTALFMLQTKLLDYFRMKNIFQDCKMNHIPADVVQLEDLVGLYEKIENQIAPNGMEPSIKKEDLIRLFSRRMSNCTIGESKMLITVNFPIRRVVKNLTLIQIVPIPFRYFDSICMVHPHFDYVGIMDKDIIPTTREDCNLFMKKCRLVKKYTMNDIKCAESLLHDAAVNDTRHFCGMTCVAREDYVVSRVKNKVYVAGAENITIFCDGQEPTKYPAQEIGNIEISLSEKCHIEVHDEAIYTMHPFAQVDKYNESTFAVTITIPSVWSNVDITKWDERPVENITEIFNTDWQKKIHVINISDVQKTAEVDWRNFTLPEAANYFFGVRMEEFVTLIWVFTNHFIIFYLVHEWLCIGYN